MKVLVAVSNPPTKEFLWTRHNVGRLFVTEYLLKKYAHIETKHKKCYEYKLRSYPNLIIGLSETFMNLSGQAVGPILRRHSVTKSDLIVVHDDLEHQFGNVRVKVGGSAQ
jgi:peptidyl-tRNA hydrolase, PTH1 family